MLALMIFTNLPYIYSAHDLVLLKGKKPFYSANKRWAVEGSGKMEKFPGRFSLLSRMALTLTTGPVALLQIHVTVG